MRYQIGTITNLGKKRSTNQDNFLVRTDRYGGMPCALLLVADGMGGLTNGDMASGLVVEEMQKWWDARQQAHTVPKKISRSLDEVIYKIHREIYAYEQQMDTRTGTTLSLVFLQGSRYLVKHVGDRRIYRLPKTRTGITARWRPDGWKMPGWQTAARRGRWSMRLVPRRSWRSAPSRAA